MRATLSILFLVCHIVASFSQEWREIIRDYGSTVCLIEVTDNNQMISTGTGFVFDEDHKILTNAHVIKDAYFNSDLTIRISFELSEYKDRKFDARIEQYSADLDLAILSSDIDIKKTAVLGDSSNLSLMDEVLVIGYPLGKSIKATPGYLQAFQQIPGIGAMLDMSASVDPGNSGGPVFSKDGKVVGIVTAKIPGHNFNLALPVNLISGFLDAESERETIVIRTQPEGANIFVDNKYRGTSPVETFYYGSRLKITAEMDGFTRSESVLSAVPEGGEFFLELEPFIRPVCSLTIHSTPSGAIVLIDNNEVGETPLTVDVGHNRKIRIRLAKRRYREYHYELYIDKETARELNLVLER